MVAHQLFWIAVIFGLCQTLFATQTTDIVSCRVWGEPHIQTWTKTPSSSASLCTTTGQHIIMNNTWIQFFMEVSSGYATRLTIDFRDGVTLYSICNFQWNQNFPIFSSDICASHGIFISDLPASAHIRTININYMKAGLNIVIVKDSSISTSHFNVQIWKPFDQNATGLCTKDTCSLTSRSLSSQPSFKMPLIKAKKICGDYIKNYLKKLTRTASERDIDYNSTISMVDDACIFDVALTGDANAASSALEILMIEELTTKATDIKSLIIQFQKGIQGATQTFQEANYELKKIVANVQ